MKYFTTGEVAKICGLKNSHIVADLVDQGEIVGQYANSRLGRKTIRKISHKALIDFMAKRNISFDRLPVGNVCAQKIALSFLLWKMEDVVVKAKKRGDLLKKAGFSSTIFLGVFEALGSQETVQDTTRNNAWAKTFRLCAELIEQHTRVCIANSKSKTKK